VALPFIEPAELRELLPIGEAIDALEEGFRQGVPPGPLRWRVPVEDAELLIMPATAPLGVGVKLVTVNAENPRRGLPLIHAVYVLFDPGSLAPRAVIDGAALTALRTSAVSGLATRYLAPPDAHRLMVFGAGVQAAAHVEAMRAVRDITEVRIVSRTGERADALVDEASANGLEASHGDPRDVGWADVVCTCTTSHVPVFDGTLLRAGAHVNAVGAHTPETRELDDEAVRRARIVVETREAALAEAGDLLLPIHAGVIDRSSIAADLSEVASGSVVRRDGKDVTIFKSVGIAFEDLVVASAALAVAGD
jgi:ornithine cyclodeaminase